MVPEQSAKTGAGMPRQRWLRYEIARLATLRNLLLAGIIAAGTCGIVVCVVLALRPNPSPPGPAKELLASAAALSGERLIPTTAEVRGKLSAFLAQSGVPEGFDLYDVQEAVGYSISNVTYVERGPTWEHAIAIMPKGRLTHMYFFSYACGHRARTTPDPYRDVMYADPQHVADRYAAQLCPECQSMRRHLDPGRQAAPRGGT